MRLIDADALMEDLQYDVELDARALDSIDIVGDREIIQFDKDCKQNCIDILRNAPTVDPVTHETALDFLMDEGWLQEHDRILTESAVKHGRWIVEKVCGEYAVCSECKGKSGTQWDGVKPIPLMTRYCPNCGARMDEEE